MPIPSTAFQHRRGRAATAVRRRRLLSGVLMMLTGSIAPVWANPPTLSPRPLPVPASAQLHYEIEGRIKGFSYRATGRLDWMVKDQRYDARMEMRMPLVGQRVQTSAGRVDAMGLQPERFSDIRKKEAVTYFDREAQRIRFGDETPELALLPGAQDRLSLFLQLGGLLQAQAHQAGDRIEFQVAGTGGAEPWRFEVGAVQEMRLPAGVIQARWLRRLPRKPNDSEVDIWLAPGLNHLPVRLRITQANGDVADQRLARWP